MCNINTIVFKSDTGYADCIFYDKDNLVGFCILMIEVSFVRHFGVLIVKLVFAICIIVSLILSYAYSKKAEGHFCELNKPSHIF